MPTPQARRRRAALWAIVGMALGALLVSYAVVPYLSLKQSESNGDLTEQVIVLTEQNRQLAKRIIQTQVEVKQVAKAVAECTTDTDGRCYRQTHRDQARVVEGLVEAQRVGSVFAAACANDLIRHSDTRTGYYSAVNRCVDSKINAFKTYPPR